ncbi:MAG TPA: DUF5615 family PIN-like protein [Rhodospirillaceae bacterium]|nr:DUF5615 family PIN-like protein [Rhodospirillaceae bacterium]
MKFLVDAQLPPALARALTALGHEAVHVADINLEDVADAIIWNEAQSRGAVIVTKDEDFIAGSRGRFKKPEPTVVWIRIGNVSRSALLNLFLPRLPEILALIEAGEIIIEVRAL